MAVPTVMAVARFINYPHTQMTNVMCAPPGAVSHISAALLDDSRNADYHTFRCQYNYYNYTLILILNIHQKS